MDDLGYVRGPLCRCSRWVGIAGAGWNNGLRGREGRRVGGNGEAVQILLAKSAAMVDLERAKCIKRTGVTVEPAAAHLRQYATRRMTCRQTSRKGEPGVPWARTPTAASLDCWRWGANRCCAALENGDREKLPAFASSPVSVQRVEPRYHADLIVRPRGGRAVRE